MRHVEEALVDAEPLDDRVNWRKMSLIRSDV